MSSLSDTDLIYKTSKNLIRFIYILIFISILCIFLVIILEILIASKLFKQDTLHSIYKWNFIVLNINEFILSISVILIFLKKLIIALRFETIGSKQDAFLNNNDGVKFVEEDRDINLSYNGGFDRLSSVQHNADHYKYSFKQSNAVNISKSSIVHIMLRLVILSIFCIFVVELLCVTLLLKRVMNIDFDSHIFEIVRSIEAFCGAMACLCIWLHFNANYRVYNVCCRCCHGCCLTFCVKCVAAHFKKKNNVIGNWGYKYTVDEDDDNYNTYISMSNM